MRRVALVFVLGLLAAAAVAVAAFGRPDGSAGDGPVEPGDRNPFAGINFITVCDFSHMNNDDPLLFPGQPGESHHHTFFGNTTTDAFSTLESLLAGGTTCSRPADKAAYWIPSLMADGEAVEPLGATIYYRRRTIDPVEPFPPGFRMIAGNAKAATPQSFRVTFWNCGQFAGVPPSSDIPICPEENRASLRLHVTFPNCWNGTDLTATNQAHVTYAAAGRCPPSHPVELPSISLIARYPVNGGGEVKLSSGGEYSGHADFFNAWDQAQLERLVDRCLNALVHCGRGRVR